MHFGPGDVEFEGLLDNECFQVSQLEIRGTPLPHGETTSLAFRISERGKSMVYASDVGYPLEGAPEHIIDFYRGADLLIHDATYTADEQEDRRHRGLSRRSGCHHLPHRCPGWPAQ